MKTTIAKICTHGYFFMTLLGAALFFSTNPVVYDFEFILAFGCHTTVYPFFAFLMAGEAGFSALAIACLVFWVLYVLGFFSSYVIAVWKKRIAPLALISLMDVLFSLGITVQAIRTVGYYDGHVPMLIGIFTSLMTCIGLFYSSHFQKMNKYENT